MTINPHLKRTFSTFYLVLLIGSTWAAIASDRVSYPAWALVGPREFGAFHHAVIVGTFRYLIPFALLGVLANILMFWLRHPAIPRSLLAVELVIEAIGYFVTTKLAIPLQKQMDHGDPSHIPALVQQLIAVDLYGRVIPGVISILILAFMIFRIMSVPYPSVKR